MIDNRIEEAINYHTSTLVGKFRLQIADLDDIQQELLLKYFEVLHETRDASKEPTKNNHQRFKTAGVWETVQKEFSKWTGSKIET